MRFSVRGFFSSPASRAQRLAFSGLPKLALGAPRPRSGGVPRVSPFARSVAASLRRRVRVALWFCSPAVLLRAAPALIVRGRVLPPVGGASAAARPPPGRRSKLCRFVAAVVGSVFGGARFWALRAVLRWCWLLGATSPPLRRRSSVARRVGGAVSSESGDGAPLHLVVPGGGRPQPPIFHAQPAPEKIHGKILHRTS